VVLVAATGIGCAHELLQLSNHNIFAAREWTTQLLLTPSFAVTMAQVQLIGGGMYR